MSYSEEDQYFPLIEPKYSWAELKSAPPMVLVVDDSAVNRRVAQLVLESLKVPATLVSNGEEALKKMSEMSFALILMDCQMPVLDGLTTSRIIRGLERDSSSHIPIIGVTSTVDQEECLRAGMDDYIPKPLNSPEGIRKLRRWLANM